MNPYSHLLKTAWKYSTGRRGLLVMSYVLFAIANVITMLEPLVFAKVVNVVQMGGPDILWNATKWLLFYSSMLLFFWIFQGPARNIERVNSFHIRKNFTKDMYRIVTRLPKRWHRDHHSGQTYDKIQKGHRAISDFTNNAYRHLESGIQFIVAFILILYFLPVYGGVAALLAIIAIVVLLRFDTVLAKSIAQANEAEHSVAATLFDYISNITTIITLRLAGRTETELEKKILRVFPPFRKSASVNEWKYFAVSGFVTIIRFAVMFLYIFDQVRAGNVILLGSLMAVYQYAERLTGGYFHMAGLHEEIVTQSTGLHAIDSILDADREFHLSEKDTMADDKQWQTIEIKNLWFKYEDTEQHAVHHIDNIAMTIPHGSRIALVGASGSGKSTLLNVLRGTEETDRVEITIDGKPYKNLSVLSETTTLFPQDPEIFENTIEYNITAGIEYNIDEVMRACDTASFSAVLGRLPQGLQSNIKEKGVNMSGGEKQRLALVRGIFAAKDSSIILMDEPTSSIDTVNELEIFKKIFSHFHDRAIIASVHRLHLLTMFDEVYVISSGKIVQRGPFATLVTHEGPLKEMWEKYRSHTQD